MQMPAAGALRAPAGFKSAIAPYGVKLRSDPPEFSPARALSPAKKAGLKYEKKALDMLEGRLRKEKVFRSPWLEFQSAAGRRFCQPDFVWVLSGWVIVFEVKVQHCELAWWQLTQLYRPVVSAWLGKPVQCVEMVKSFDPGVFWPGALQRVAFRWGDVQCVPPEKDDDVAVFQWRPQTRYEAKMSALHDISA